MELQKPTISFNQQEMKLWKVPGSGSRVPLLFHNVHVHQLQPQYNSPIVPPVHMLHSAQKQKVHMYTTATYMTIFPFNNAKRKERDKRTSPFIKFLVQMTKPTTKPPNKLTVTHSHQRWADNTITTEVHLWSMVVY